jgi:hypothetical protein
VGKLIGMLAGRLVSRLAGKLVGRLTGKLWSCLRARWLIMLAWKVAGLPAGSRWLGR